MYALYCVNAIYVLISFKSGIRMILFHVYLRILKFLIAYTCHVYVVNTITYRIRSLFGGDFNLAVWRFFVHPPKLNDANIIIIAIIYIAATAFRQIKVMPTTITDRFAKYLTRQ